jgi:peptidoglycan/xylan/chitin deacetylase (PgdA/CDA1 family)
VTGGRRERAAGLLAAAPLRAATALPTWSGVLVLNYHRVGDGAASDFDRTLWSASAEGFDAQLAFLARHADVIGPPDLQDALGARRGRHVLLTFDDGYRDNHDIAYPLLRRHGLRATFFLATGFLDRPRPAWWDELAWMVRHATRPPGVAAERTIRGLTERYKRLPGSATAAFLDEVAERTGAGRCPPERAAGEWMTWDMARELRDGGMWIGGHTVEHPVLAALSIEDQAAEIDGCARRLREELDEPMRWFSYPVGARAAFTRATGTLLTSRGVRACFSFYGGHQPAGRWSPIDVPRVHVGPRCDERMLRAMLAFPWIFARRERA